MTANDGPGEGSRGELELQARFGTQRRARAFRNSQCLGFLNPRMREFVRDRELMFVATADARGNCDCTLRAGPRGFVRVLDEHTLAYPEYRGNGVMASQGNIFENAHVGLIFVDFFEDAVGLHVNGCAVLVENADFLGDARVTEEMRRDLERNEKRLPERWVVVGVDEAYIHCTKHIPLLQKRPRTLRWVAACAPGDYFEVKASRCRKAR